jgi:hypothetical protein
MTRTVIVAALLIAASSLPIWAQDSHESHHPPQAQAPESPLAAAPGAPPATGAQGSAQGQMPGMMMSCAMMQGAQPNQGTAENCPMMQGVRGGMMQGQMQPGHALGAAAETPKAK